MKPKVYLLSLFTLGITGMSLPVRPQADVETRSGREEVSSEITPFDTLSSFNLNRLDLTAGSGATDEDFTDSTTLAASLPTDRTSSDGSIIELEGLPKRDVTSFRRTINLTLKSAVHGLTGTFTWVINIAINPDQSKSWLGPYRLGAQADFSPADSTSGTTIRNFSARELHHSVNNWLTAWRMKVFYNSNTSKGNLVPDINWQETFSTFSGFWGAEPVGIQQVTLQWELNGQVQTIDPSLYDITIGT